MLVPRRSARHVPRFWRTQATTRSGPHESKDLIRFKFKGIEGGATRPVGRHHLWAFSRPARGSVPSETLIESQFRPAALPSFRARFQGITTERYSRPCSAYFGT